MRNLARAAVLVGTVLALTATAAPAFAAVTQPTTSPFTVARGRGGKPATVHRDGIGLPARTTPSSSSSATELADVGRLLGPHDQL